MAKVRVYELAKEFGVESKVVMAKLQELGEFVRSASSTIEAPVVRKLTDALQQGNGGGNPPPRARPHRRGRPRPPRRRPHVRLPRVRRRPSPRPPAARGPCPGSAPDAGSEARAAPRPGGSGFPGGSGPRCARVHGASGGSGGRRRLDPASGCPSRPRRPEARRPSGRARPGPGSGRPACSFRWPASGCSRRASRWASGRPPSR
ncbi:hypothetical protein E4K10_31180 [Streptomyces sp. T1317-0309]|nr:hypothetical protein E4K10_31180 [Streptomyces sp. T1317-0309]